MIRANAVVAVPPGSEIQGVCVVGHVLKVGEALWIDDGSALLRMKAVAFRTIFAAQLPILSFQWRFCVMVRVRGGGSIEADREL